MLLPKSGQQVLSWLWIPAVVGEWPLVKNFLGVLSNALKIARNRSKKLHIRNVEDTQKPMFYHVPHYNH